MSYREVYDALFAERDQLRARVAELEAEREQIAMYITSIEAKLDERQEALADIADGVDNPYYDPEAIGCGLEDRGLTDRYEAAAYGWHRCQESYRSWIEGITGTLVAEPAKESTP